MPEGSTPKITTPEMIDILAGEAPTPEQSCDRIAKAAHDATTERLSVACGLAPATISTIADDVAGATLTAALDHIGGQVALAEDRGFARGKESRTGVLGELRDTIAGLSCIKDAYVADLDRIAIEVSGHTADPMSGIPAAVEARLRADATAMSVLERRIVAAEEAGQSWLDDTVASGKKIAQLTGELQIAKADFARVHDELQHVRAANDQVRDRLELAESEREAFRTDATRFHSELLEETARADGLAEQVEGFARPLAEFIVEAQNYVNAPFPTWITDFAQPPAHVDLYRLEDLQRAIEDLIDTTKGVL